MGDKERLLQYITVLNGVAKSNPRLAPQLTQQALQLYASFLDSQTPEAVLGEEKYGKLLKLGINPEGITQENVSYLSPFLSQVDSFVNESGEMEDESDGAMKRISVLKALLENPALAKSYQEYQPGDDEILGAKQMGLGSKPGWFKKLFGAKPEVTPDVARNYAFREYLPQFLGEEGYAFDPMQY